MAASMDVDTIVIGAGVVGLAVAREVAAAGREVFVLETCERPGEGISSRNSGVIHAGMYYPTGSLKARFCVRGQELLYRFCARRGVAHRRIGKLIVAVSEAERVALEALYQRGLGNGLQGLRMLEAAEAVRMEPALHCVAAIDSPASGIVDVPELVMALVGELEAAGGRLVCNTEVTGVAAEAEGFRVDSRDGGAIRCRRLVNAAGLEATDVAAGIMGLDRGHVPQIRYASGHYYNIGRRSPFSRLIYPLPEKAGLGVHLGVDISGRCRFGPDVRWIPKPDYRFDDSQRARFAASVRRWWPALKDEELTPDFVGVRPKLTGPNEPNADFLIQDSGTHGVPGLVNLFGIESPGLTSSLAIAEDVRKRLDDL